MSIEISHEPKTGRWSISYKRHLFVAVGMAFLAAGLAALTGPWWQPFVAAALGLAAIKVDAAPNYGVAGLLIVIGLANLAYKYWVLDPGQTKLALDKAIVSKYPPDTTGVRRYLSDLVDDHAYRSSFDSVFHNAYTRFNNPVSAFQDRPTIAVYEAFSSRAAALHDFVYSCFYVFPDNQGPNPDYRYCLEPDLNFERNMLGYDLAKVARYDDLKRQLHALAGETLTSYDAFIRHLAKHGYF